MNDNTGIDSKDYNMQIHNDFNQNRGLEEVDKIREEFGKWMPKTNKGLFHRAFLFEAYIAGHKSRDDEVLALTSRVAVAEGKAEELEAENKEFEKGYHLDKHTIKEYRAENKKLMDALEHIIEYRNGENVSTADAIEEAMDTAKEALKDGE